MESKPNSTKIILQILIAVVATGIVINLFTNIVESPLKELLSTYYEITIWGIVIVLIVILFGLERFFGNNNQTSESNYYRMELLDGLKSRYDRWLRSKMNDELLFDINLKLSYVEEGTESEFIKKYYIDNYEIGDVESFEQLFEDYLCEFKRLLIIGEPGSGKTVLLLKFAQKLLKIAQEDDNFPIPIIINLASYNEVYKSFQEWLADSLTFAAGEYGASSHQAKMLSSDNLLLMLDGLDEMPSEVRVKCVEDLSQYMKIKRRTHRSSYPEVIICCRREEYITLKSNAPARVTVSIQPLTIDQVSKSLHSIRHLQGNGESATILLNTIEIRPEFASLLTTVFYVHITLKLVDSPNFRIDTINDHSDIIRVYIEEQLNLVEYKSDNSIKWLSWIARYLQKNKNTVTFELKDLQPTNIGQSVLFTYKTVYALFSAVCFVLLINNSKHFLQTDVSWQSIFIFTFLFNFITNNSIIAPEIVQYNIRNYSNKKFTLYFVFFFILFFVRGYFIVNNMNVYYSLVSAICTALPMSLAASLLNARPYPVVKTHYQRLNSGFLFYIIHYGFLMIIGLIVFQLIRGQELYFSIEETYDKLIGLVVIIAVSMPISSHFTLRIILNLKNYIPLRLVTFLNVISLETGLMERDGGQWRFKHQLIQNYFAEQNSTRIS